MKSSTDRILTTHAGSLSRPANLIALGRARAAGDSKDDAEFAQVLAAAVGDVVKQQRALGVDQGLIETNRIRRRALLFGQHLRARRFEMPRGRVHRIKVEGVRAEFIGCALARRLQIGLDLFAIFFVVVRQDVRIGHPHPLIGLDPGRYMPPSMPPGP